MAGEASVSIQFECTADPGIEEAVAHLVASACGVNASAVGIFRQTVPFESVSECAERLVRQQTRHPLADRRAARITSTHYTDGVVGMVVVLRFETDPALRRLLTDLNGLGARFANAQFDDADYEAATVLDTGDDRRVESIAAASIIALSRYLDSYIFALSVAPSVEAVPAIVVCDTSPNSSVSDLVSAIKAVIELPKDGRVFSEVVESQTNCIQVVDHRDTHGLLVRQVHQHVDVQISIRNGPRPGTTQLVAQTASAVTGRYLRNATDCIDILYPQIRKTTSDSLVRDLVLGDPGVPASVALENPQPAMRIEHYVRAHSASSPDSLAVIDESASLTFRELDVLAEDITANLWQLRVRPGDFVAVATAPSVDMYAVILAIWKCGAAYVPIDVGFPPERINTIISESGARLAVVDPGLEDVVRSEVVTAVVKDLKKRSETLGSDNVVPHQSLTQPAYAIFTSGTTGVPKGAVVTHASVAALIEGLREELSLTGRDVWSNFHSPAFDFSVWEMWGPMVTGGTAIIVARDIARDPYRFHEWLREHRVTVLSQTPSAFAHLATVDTSCPRLEKLRLVVLGGEPLNPSAAAAWLDRYPSQTQRLVNMYGITETTVHVTTQDVDKHVALRAPRSVGRAIPGWRYRVIGSDMRPVPTAVPGEIYVGGAGLALFYLGRAGLTAQRFVAGADGQRWYRTGDLGRLLPNGNLEHLGRIDNQVKINGYRIELDEIKSTILLQPNVRDAAVICAVGGGRFEVPRIDAYVVGASVDLPALRNAVSRSLPHYMWPATFTEVPQFELTINGKIDLSKLPQPINAKRSTNTNNELALIESVGPAHKLKQAWSEVLGVPPSPDANFFVNGGNSLAAIHLRTQLTKLGVEMPLSTLYANPTFSALAAALSD